MRHSSLVGRRIPVEMFFGDLCQSFFLAALAWVLSNFYCIDRRPLLAILRSFDFPMCFGISVSVSSNTVFDRNCFSMSFCGCLAIHYIWLLGNTIAPWKKLAQVLNRFLYFLLDFLDVCFFSVVEVAHRCLELSVQAHTDLPYIWIGLGLCMLEGFADSHSYKYLSLF